MKHKYIDCFFAAYDAVLALCAIFGLFNSNPFIYRFLLIISAAELCLRRVVDARSEFLNEN